MRLNTDDFLAFHVAASSAKIQLPNETIIRDVLLARSQEIKAEDRDRHLDNSCEEAQKDPGK